MLSQLTYCCLCYAAITPYHLFRRQRSRVAAAPNLVTLNIIIDSMNITPATAAFCYAACYAAFHCHDDADDYGAILHCYDAAMS